MVLGYRVYSGEKVTGSGWGVVGAGSVAAKGVEGEEEKQKREG